MKKDFPGLLIKGAISAVILLALFIPSSNSIAAYSQQKKEKHLIAAVTENNQGTENSSSHMTPDEKLLFEFTKVNDIKKVNELIKKGVNVNAQDQYGGTALMIAAYAPSLEIVQTLIKARADVTKKSNMGTTALHFACLQWKGDSQPSDPDILILKELIKAGADVNVKDAFGWTPLYCLALARCPYNNVITAAINTLLDAGADIDATNNEGATTLHAFCGNAMLDAVRVLIHRGADVNAKGSEGLTPLHYATKNSWVDYYSGGEGPGNIVRELIKAGANIYATDKKGNSPLMNAIKYNQRLSEQYLREAGALIDEEAEAQILAKRDELLLKAIQYSSKIYQRHTKDAEERLLEAAANGDIDTVKTLLKHGANPNGQEQWVFSAKPLTRAVQFRRVAVVQELLKAGARIDEMDWDGETVLHVAAENGELSILKMLIRAGADVNRNGILTPLVWAALRGHIDIVRELISKGASVNTSMQGYGNALHAAVTSGRTEVVRVLIQAGAHVNDLDGNEETPLNDAVLKGNITIVQELLNAGADVNRTNKNGKIPLAVALEKGYDDIAKLLCNATVGLKPVEKERDLECDLLTAAEKGTIEQVRDLIRQGADVNVQDEYGFTPLISAIINEHLDICKELVKAGADVNMKSEAGMTALHFLGDRLYSPLSTNDLECMNELVHEGADVNSQTNSGNTPLMLILSRIRFGDGVDAFDEFDKSYQEADASATEIMLNAGLDPNIADKEGNTMLHEAAEDGNVKAVKMLLLKGANPNAIEQVFGETPLHYAAWSGNKEVVKLLIKAGAQLNVKDRRSDSTETAIDGAFRLHRCEIQKMLEEAGAEISPGALTQRTQRMKEYPEDEFFWAAEEGDTQSIMELIQKGININARIGREETALMLAALYGQRKIVQILLQNGADVKIKNHHDRTALHFAVRGGNVDLIKLILTAHADINAIDSLGNTPLHYAAEYATAEVSEKLIRHGANLNIKNELDMTPLQIALKRGDKSIIKLFR